MITLTHLQLMLHVYYAFYTISGCRQTAIDAVDAHFRVPTRMGLVGQVQMGQSCHHPIRLTRKFDSRTRNTDGAQP